MKANEFHSLSDAELSKKLGSFFTNTLDIFYITAQANHFYSTEIIK